jgi:hypothetical protein
MLFRAIYSEVWRQRIEQLLIEAKSVGVVREIKDVLSQLNEIMEQDPIGFGEPLYRLKYVGLTAFVVVRRYMAVDYSVDEDRKLVYVMRFSFSGNHPYPPEFEEILNPKKP